MKIAVILLLLAVVEFQLSAQERIITGTVKDADTKQPLAYCNVFILHIFKEISRNA